MTLAPIEVAAAASSHSAAGDANLFAEIASSTHIVATDAEVPLEITTSRGPGYLATLTLANTSTTATQAAGQPTPVFGWCFKDGDVQPGTAPVFTVGSTAQPYSAGLQTYWPSGSLKFAAFMLLPTFSIPAASSQAVVISKGGAWPAASGRKLAEVYNQNLVVNAPLYNSPQNGRGGVMSLKSWLNGDLNQFQTVKWLDGAAGTGWRISTHMAQNVGGAIDGMLVCDHYVIALNSSSSGLGGFRWLGAMGQPFYNQSGQSNNAPGGYIFFAPPSTSNPTAGVNWSVQPGGTGPIITTPLTWLGNDGNTFDTANFTCAGGTATCVIANGGNDNYYMGAGGSQFLPVGFSNINPNTSQGSGWGTNVEDGGFAFLWTDGNNPTTQQTQFELFQWGQQNYSTQYNFSSAFTGTVTPCPCLPPFFRLFFATKDATYNFFQGSGSIATETALHCQIDQAYWQGSGVIPPFNLSVNGSAFDGAITEFHFTYTWYPYSVGSMTIQEPGTGDHNDIGILPMFASNDFYNQTLNTLRHNRIIGLSCSFSVTDFIDAPSRTRLNLGSPSGAGGAGGYGLAAPSNSGINYNPSFGANAGGFSYPSTTGLGYALSLGEHEPAWPVWAYLRTGEMQFLDLIVDQQVMEQLATGSNRTISAGNAGISTTLYGGNFGSNEMRSLAWSSRDAQWAAHLYPRDPTGNSANPVFSDGTNIAQYLWDSAESCVSWPLLQFQTAAPTIPWTSWSAANGFWFPWFAYNVALFGGVGMPAFGVSGGSWQYADFIQAMCLAVARGSANAKIFIESCPVPQWVNDLATLGGWLYISDSNRYAYYPADDNTGQYSRTLIDAKGDYGMPPFSLFANITAGHNYITWAANNNGGAYTQPAFTMTTGYGGGSLFGWHPSDGDIYIPLGYAFGNPNDLWPSELSPGTPYYAVNVTASGSNYLFDLATSPGGSPVLINESSGPGVSFGFKLQPAYKPPTHTVYTDVYLGNFWFAVCWATALGITGFGSLSDTTTVLGDIHNRMGNSSAGSGGIDVTGYFNDAVGVVDTRYCMQPSFG